MTTAELVRQLETTRDETLGYFALDTHMLDRTYGPGKWSIRYLLHHLADSETVLNERIRRVLAEPPRTLMVFDQEAWALELDYAGLPLDISRDVYASVRRGIIHLARLRYETHGHLTFVHSTQGPRTLREEFEKVATHNAKHLGHIRLALDATDTR
jgi:hypothetical protein